MYKTASKSKHHHSQFDLASDFENIKDALADASFDVKGRLNEILTQSMKDMKTKSIDVKDNVGEYIVEKPYKAVGIALGLGLLLGLFFRRKSRSRL